MKRRKTEIHSPEPSASPEIVSNENPSQEMKKDSNDDSSHNVDMILEQDRFLPIANISRIMKRVIPSDGKLSKEAKECVQECITEFLLFITSEASEKCANEKRKTITGEDLINAFQTLGFDGYIEPLKEFLYKYREANKLHSMKSEERSPNNDLIPPKLSSYASTDHGLQQQQETQPITSQDLPHFDGPMSSSSSTPNYGQKQKMEPVMISSPTFQQLIIFRDSSSGQHYQMIQNADGSQALISVNVTPANVGDNSAMQNNDDGEEQTVRSFLQSNQSNRKG